MSPIEIPPSAERPPDAPHAETRTVSGEDELRPGGSGRKFRGNGRGRYDDLQQHELVMLLDEVDDERARARFRESVYISVIVWLVLGWVLVYGPRYLWHAPVIVTQLPQDKHQNTMTYLDTPPDLKRFQRKTPAPNISERNSEAQSPKPNPRIQPTPRAGTPAPPAPKPQPSAPQPRQIPPQPQPPAPQPQQQMARNTPPVPVPPAPKPQPNQPPLADAPAPTRQPNRSIFNQPQSAADQIAQAARGSRSAGDTGDYGNTGSRQNGGAKQGLQILSDTQGVDFGKYLARLLSDVRRNWLPLIPEECRPPLSKQGITGVRFSILPDGRITGMNLDYSTHDEAINRAAWGAITGLGQAQPLPKEFHGPNLELRIEFRINKDLAEAQ